MTCTDSKNIDEQERERQLRDQETALVQLGKLYRDQKYVHILLDCTYSDPKSLRNAKGVAEIITLSRSFMSSTAKAKTAKLSA
jgi:26S proteasome regulatory subunit N6